MEPPWASAFSDAWADLPLLRGAQEAVLGVGGPVPVGRQPRQHRIALLARLHAAKRLLVDRDVVAHALEAGEAAIAVVARPRRQRHPAARASAEAIDLDLEVVEALLPLEHLVERGPAARGRVHEVQLVVTATEQVTERATRGLDQRRIGRQRRQPVALVGLPVPVARQLDAGEPAPLRFAHHALDLVGQFAEGRGLGWRHVAHALDGRSPGTALQFASGAAQRVGGQAPRAHLHQHQAEQRTERQRRREQHDQQLRLQVSRRRRAGQQRHQRRQRERGGNAGQQRQPEREMLEPLRGGATHRIGRRGVRPRHRFDRRRRARGRAGSGARRTRRASARRARGETGRSAL